MEAARGAGLALVSCQLSPFPRASPFFERLNGLLEEERLRGERFREVGCPLPTWLLSRRSFAAVGGFAERPSFPEDLDWWLRCCADSRIRLLK